MIYQNLISKKEKLAVIGLGYVGLPIALEFAKKLSVIGFDIREDRLELMRKNIDPSNELEADAFHGVLRVRRPCRARLLPDGWSVNRLPAAPG